MSCFELAMRTGALLLATITGCQAALAQPVGIGGGGAFFVPSINPAATDEFYVASDMSELFHTTSYGASYGLVSFQQFQGGSFARVRFTSDPSTRYGITSVNDTGTPCRSTDGGSTWAVLPGNPDPTEYTYTINVDYANPGRVLISYYGAIHSSSDGGATFANVHNAANGGAGIVVGGAFYDGNAIYLGTNDGLLVSTNGGASFNVAPVSGIPATEVIWSFAGAKQGGTTRFFCLTANPADVYVGLMGYDYWTFIKGVYTLDWPAGPWQSRLNGIDILNDFLMYVAMAGNDISTCYLGGSSSVGENNVMRTTDGGQSWQHVFLTAGNQNIATGWAGDGGDRGWGYPECVLGFAVADSDKNRIVTTDFGMIHGSSDGGATWRQAYLSRADENPAGQMTPQGKAYHGVGAEDTSCWQVAWLDANNVYACFSDIRAIRSTDGGSSWSFNYSGLSGNSTYRLVKHPTTGLLYAGQSSIHDMYQSTRLQDAILDGADSNGKIIFSQDNGATWQDMHFFGHPVFWLALDPTNGNRMYASVVHSTLGGVFVSNDIQNGAGSTWTKLPNPPRTEGHPASILVLNDGTVVATYSGRRDASGAFTASSGCFIYSGGSWTDRSDSGMDYWTKDVVADPYDATQNRWYVGVFSGWGGPPNGLGGLYKTTNRGQSWTRLTSGLDRVTSCTISPTNPDEMYVTTETQGLWYSSNINAPSPSFSLVSSYLFRQPERVFYNPYAPSQVWVTSFGNGITILGVSGGPEIVTGPGPGSTNGPNVRGFTVTGALNGATNFTAYGAGGYGANVAAGNVRSATATACDILTGPGPGAIYGPQARGFRRDGTAIGKTNFYAYGTLRYGVNITSGDVDGDGYEEILTGAGPGAVFGPHVRGFNFDNGSITAIAKISFFAYNTLKWGVQAAGGGVDADPFVEILTAPGPSAVFSAQVRGFNFDNGTLAAIGKVNFVAYPFFYGGHVTGGDLDNDGIEEILTAPGPDPIANARIRGYNFDGGTLTSMSGVDFDGSPGTNRSGATVDSVDIDGDGYAEMVVGVGYDWQNGAPRVRGWNYDGATVTAIATLDFDAYSPTQRYGVNLAVDTLAP